MRLLHAPVLALAAAAAAGAGCAGAPVDRAEAMIREQKRIAEIPAPTGREELRAAYVAREFRRAGLTGVDVDAAGNVLGWKRGSGARVLAVTAHLDTVHPDAEIRIRREGNVLHGPGASDDAAGLVGLLEIARRWDRPHAADLLFVGTVAEEGRGDLRGVKHLVRTRKIDLFVSLDGAKPGRIIHGGIGSRRWRIGFESEGGGGHSWADFGRANPAHALARMITAFAGYPAPASPRTTFNVGVVTGIRDGEVMGTSINTIPPAAVAQVDMRSRDPGELAKLEAHLMACADRALREENAWTEARGPAVPVRPVRELVGDRPFGRTAPDHELVRVVREELERAGLTVTLGWASTDANAAMAAGIPAVTLSSGGRATGVHGRQERYDATGRVREIDALREALFRLASGP